MDVPFLDLQKSYKDLKPEIDRGIQRILDKGNFILGEELKCFEKNFAEYIGVDYFTGVGNGSDALDIALQALNLNKDDEVITQANTYIATCLAPIHNQCKLVLCDCNKETHQISIDDLEDKITTKTKVLIIVHLYGLVSDMDKICELCTKYNIILIEDVAQAHGASWKGKRLGSFGKMACFSFYPGKNLGAFGDGGGIATNNKVLHDKIRLLRNYGSVVKYHYDIVGRNSRLDTIQAAILDVKLKYLNANNEKRRKGANLYKQLLCDVDKIVFPEILEDSVPVYHLLVIKTKYRDDLQKFLKTKGIQIFIHYPITCGQAKCFQYLKPNVCPNAIELSQQILSLPLYPELSEESIKYVCDNIKDFFTSLNQRILKFDTIKTQSKNGVLHCLNQFNFNAKRIFYIDNFDTEPNNNRGNHANIDCNEFVFICKGSAKFSLTNQQNETITYFLGKNEGILINKLTWVEFNSDVSETILLVLCDTVYQEDGNINNFNDFLKYESD